MHAARLRRHHWSYSTMTTLARGKLFGPPHLAIDETRYFSTSGVRLHDWLMVWSATLSKNLARTLELRVSIETATFVNTWVHLELYTNIVINYDPQNSLRP